MTVKTVICYIRAKVSFDYVRKKYNIASEAHSINHKYDSMTKMIPTLMLLLFTVMGFSQSESVEITPLSDTEICRGYTTKNIARVQMISDLPNFVNDPQIFVTYTWRAEHPNGNKTWNTSSPLRVIPIPWTGEYTIQCTVEFVVLGNSNPFKKVESNTLKVNGKTCETNKLNQAGKLKNTENNPAIKN